MTHSQNESPAAGTWGLRLVELVSDLIAIIQDGRLVYANGSGARMMGFDGPAPLIGKPVQELAHRDYRELMTAEGLAMLADEESSVTMKLVRPTDGELDVDLTVRRLGDVEGGYMMEARDITQSKRSAEALREREAKLSGILDAVIEAIITISTEGRIQSFNAAASRIFGFMPEEIIGQPISRLMPEPYATEHASYMQRYAKGGKSWIMNVARELPGRRRDGTVFPIEIHITEMRQGKEPLFIGVIRDISERVKAEERLRLSATVFETAAEGILVTDDDFKVTVVNSAVSAITGYEAAEIVGQKPPFLSSPYQDERFFLLLWEALMRTGGWEGELWDKKKSGERYAQRLSISTVKDERGIVQQYVMVFSDITRRRLDEERIRYQATHDMLTELPNRMLFLEQLSDAVELAHETSKRGALLFLDLDGFKLVNDTLGHDIGDFLLREASRRLVHVTRDNDLLARLGGDEFAVLLPNIASEQEAVQLTETIIDAMRVPFDLEGYEAFVTANIGIALFPDASDSPQALLKNATAAKTKAKELTKVNYAFFTPDITDAFNERLAIKTNLVKALERGEFHLLYQPKLDMANGQIMGVEALLRWRNPWLGFVSPVRFIPVLEETGQIVEVGEWVIETACRQQKAWAEAGYKDVKIAVNLSARQIRPGLAELVESILKKTGACPTCIEIEITESLIMGDADLASQLLKDLSAMGIPLAMDDFGTGYSSLSYLKRFPLDTIKIDRSFVKDLVADSDDAEIVRTIITMGHSLRRRIVAEGVETLEQLAVLNDLECDEIQGYLVSPPVAPERIVELLLAPPGPGLLKSIGAAV
ncbi:MAG: EAL domain-containing protein [Rhodospirillales bacterium]|jgi:diguanylate cyclase (GGDEF)-like protein/PAS domain S-box-containing protein